MKGVLNILYRFTKRNNSFSLKISPVDLLMR